MAEIVIILAGFALVLGALRFYAGTGQPAEIRGLLWTNLWVVWKPGRWWTLRVRRELAGLDGATLARAGRRAREQLGQPEPAFTCPVCGMTSHHPDDVRAGYCGNCHDWTGAPNATC